MFQTQQTSLIRSWKWKKGKVGCDWVGGGWRFCARACLELHVGGGVSPLVSLARVLYFVEDVGSGFEGRGSRKRVLGAHTRHPVLCA